MWPLPGINEVSTSQMGYMWLSMVGGTGVFVTVPVNFEGREGEQAGL